MDAGRGGRERCITRAITILSFRSKRKVLEESEINTLKV